MRKFISGKERKVSFWAGGSSSQICIWPQTAQYANRDFLYRISTAVADTDDWSDYTPLDGVTRHLLMLEGSAVVSHTDRYDLTMHPFEEIDVFDGGWTTRAKGQVTDFNLMCRETCKGNMTVLQKDRLGPFDGHRLLFCAEGEVTVSFADENIVLQKKRCIAADRWGRVFGVRIPGSKSCLL